MKETARIQNEIDALAKMRTYWRDMRNFICADQSKDMAKIFRQRIKNLCDSKIETLDTSDPTDSIAIAKAQSARDVLKKIIAEMDEQVCSAQLNLFDDQIKAKNEEMKIVLSRNNADEQNFYKQMEKRS